MQNTAYQRNKIYLVTILIVSKKSPITPPYPLFFAPFCTFGRKQKSPKVIDLQGFSLFCFSCLWCHQESNRGHKDFQSFALPTELWHHHCRICECKDKRIFGIYKICRSKMTKIYFSDNGFHP